MKRASILAFTLLASLSLPYPALADVPPPNFEGCDMKKAGDTCVKDDESDGTCVQQKCSKLDYSMGTPPTTVEYDCVLCSGPAAPPTTEPTPDDEGCSVALPGATAGSMSAGAVVAAALLLMRRRRPRKENR